MRKEMAMRADVRQCDPPRAPTGTMQDLLHTALPLLVFLLHLAAALSQLRACPGIEPVTFHQVQPIVRFSNLHRLSDHCTFQTQTITFSQQLKLLFVRRPL